MKRATIIEIIIFLYAVLFIYTAISKLLDFHVFKQQLSESPVLGMFADLLAIVVPVTEIFLTMLLIVPRWRLRGMYGSLFMMVTFTIYIITLLTFSNKLPCSCGGIISNLSWPQHIIFNCSFIGLSIVGIFLEKRNRMDAEKNWQQIRPTELGMR